MSEYVKISGLTAGTALGGTEVFEAVQGSASVGITPAQISTYAHANPPAGVTNTVSVTGEYFFTEDNELDYSASFVDAMSAATVTFAELPTDTREILVRYNFTDSGVYPGMVYKRTSGGTATVSLRGSFADAGTNYISGVSWLPTTNNSIYVTNVAGDDSITFVIYGYKTGA